MLKFLFPCDALRCIRDLSRVSGGRMLLLSADEGYSSEEELLRQGVPEFRHHGSFSTLVNYHALGEYVRRRGGQVMHPGHSSVNLNVSAFLLGHSTTPAHETQRAFEESVLQFGPDDFFILKKGIEKMYEHLSLPQMLACIRLSGGDANILLGALPVLDGLVEACTDSEREELKNVLQQVWENYYPIGEERDLPFEIGVLLYRSGWYREAIQMFHHSLRLHGPRSWTLYDMGLCHYMLAEQQDAQTCLDEARRIDPNCPDPPWGTAEFNEPENRL